MVQSIVHRSFGTEEFLVHFGSANGLLGINWNFKTVSDVLSGSQTSQETAVLGSSIPGIPRINDHSLDVS